MISKHNTAEILNDLVAMHNDRIIGYDIALKELDDSDEELKQLFLTDIKQSHDIKMNLGNEVQLEGDAIEEGTTVLGKIYRSWMDLKAALTWQDRKSVLASCEFGEDAMQRAYSEALEEELPEYLRLMLKEQKEELKVSHDEIKSLRNALS